MGKAIYMQADMGFIIVRNSQLTTQNTPMTSQARHLNNIPRHFMQDYGQAIVHVAWMLSSEVRHLVFGYMEFLPMEYPKADETPESTFNKKMEGRLFFTRIRMDAETALNIYTNLVEKGELHLPVGPAQSNKQLLISSPEQEAVWPNLVLDTELPFPGSHGCANRAHHIYPGAPSLVDELKNNEDALLWLKDRLFFSLSEYEELLGSFHLIAHNPVFRCLSVKLADAEDGREIVVYAPELRANQSCDSLTLHHFEQRLTGWFGSSTVVKPFRMEVELAGRANKVGHAVVCKDRGLLDLSGPFPFLRQIHASFNVQSKTNTIHVPPKGKKRPKETYSVTRKSSDLPMIIGEDTTPEVWRRIAEGQQRRKLQQEAEKHGQHWFYDAPDQAKRTVRKLVAAARERVWIIDPYFTAIELFRYALNTTHTTVDILVATSALVLAKKSSINKTKTDKEMEEGEVLLGQLPQLQKEYDISVIVLTGDQPPIHDRFLVIDNAVWFVGNSLHTLGERAGMMIKLPYPQPVIENLNDIIQGPRSIPLKTWVKNRQKSKEVNSRCPILIPQRLRQIWKRALRLLGL